MKTYDCTYIFHVIGTLEMRHVEWALRSLREQVPFRWRRFVLYNASPLDSKEILAQVPAQWFDEMTQCDSVTHHLKSCAADWKDQMDTIDGSERYLCHKADFFLPPWICRDFQRVPRSRGEFIVPFNKYDMKSRATLGDVRRFAGMRWSEGIEDPQAGEYRDHLGKLAIPFEQQFGKMDATMHGYTDGMRALYKPGLTELYQRWGVAQWFRELDRDHRTNVLRDRRFFAAHMWHESPDRKDWNKNMSPEERF